MHLASTTFLCSYITLLVTGVKDLSLHCNFCLFEQCRTNVLFCGHFEQYIYTVISGIGCMMGTRPALGQCWCVWVSRA